MLCLLLYSANFSTTLCLYQNYKYLKRKGRRDFTEIWQKENLLYRNPGEQPDKEMLIIINVLLSFSLQKIFDFNLSSPPTIFPVGSSVTCHKYPIEQYGKITKIFVKINSIWYPKCSECFYKQDINREAVAALDPWESKPPVIPGSRLSDKCATIRCSCPQINCDIPQLSHFSSRGAHSNQNKQQVKFPAASSIGRYSQTMHLK